MTTTVKRGAGRLAAEHRRNRHAQRTPDVFDRLAALRLDQRKAAFLREVAGPGVPAPVSPLYLGLARVSSDDQVLNGHSLDAQDERLHEEATRRGVELELIPVPARSGKSMSPELRGALDRLARGEAAGLMVTKMDRLTRRVSIASDVIAAAQRQGWNLIIADLGIDLSTWQGRAMAHMLATFAEVERELISERRKEGLAAAKRNGTKSGNPIGPPALVSREVIATIIAEREQGLSFAAIARDLSTRGVLSPAGRPVWQESTARRIYAREAYPSSSTEGH